MIMKVCSVIFNQVLYDLCLYKAQISGEHLQDHWSSGSMAILQFPLIQEEQLLVNGKRMHAKF